MVLRLEQLEEAVRVRAQFATNQEAADFLGLARKTFTDRLELAASRGIKLGQQTSPESIPDFPEFVTIGDKEEPIEDLLNRQRLAFGRKHKAAHDRQWFRVGMKETKPYAILWFGDPHLDDSGCNWPLLERHLTIARQDGVYGGNIGDTTNNWPWTGRLARLCAESSVSHQDSRRIAEWFMYEAGVNWLMWILGNHDEWNNGTDFYKRLGAHNIPVMDWRAQFTLTHRNGSETRVDAAHGRKGNSLYNPVHGTLRDAKFGQDCNLFVTGHIHSYGLFEYEIPERQTKTWLAQVRGYKWHDHYAKVNGFAEYEHGAAVMSIIDPETGRVHCYGDPEEGYEILKWKRSR